MRRNRFEVCPHPEHETTEHHGLRRSVCRSCGDITIHLVDTSSPGVLFRDWEQVGGFVEPHPEPSV